MPAVLTELVLRRTSAVQPVHPGAARLELWEGTDDELFVGDVAKLAKERAHMAADAIATLVRRRAAATTPDRGCQQVG